jgi:hydrogenase nickel incorporation protein HypA/HybF
VHEYALVQNLLDQVSIHAEARGATAVKCITVRLGELAGVDPELFAAAFDTFRVAGRCRGAQLVISRVEARWVCTQCGRFLERGAVLRCPVCQLPARLAEGDELLLQRIELEVAEPQILQPATVAGAAPAD